MALDDVNPADVLVLDPDPDLDAHPLRALWNHAAGHRGAVIVASIYSFLNKLFDLAPDFLIGMAVDIVVRGEGSLIGTWFGIASLRSQLGVLAVITAVIWIGESVFQYLYQVAWRNLAQTLQHELRLDAYTHVQTLEQAYFEDRSTGGLLSILNDDVNQLERFLDNGANAILQLLVTVTFVGASFFILLTPEVAIWAFVPIPVILVGSFRFQRHLEPLYADVRDRVGRLNATLNNNLQGIATIKAFTAEDREVERISSESDDYRDANGRAIRYSSAFVPLIRIVILGGFIAILVLGGFLALDGKIEVGQYSVMVFITQRLLWPLTALGETFDQYQRAMASTRRILGLLHTEPVIREGATALPTVEGSVRFDNVRFSYGEGDEVLRGLDLDVPVGASVAIVGATGAGKSTIVKLLLRLYDVDSGVVSVDGHDVRDLAFAELRGAIGLVSQDVFLFHGTVRENIAYGNPSATDEEVAYAAGVAEASEFIAALPHGYDTIVGERGQKLSGGQRQRISIARAVLKNPPILVLDEATSSVDNETEAAIQRSLDIISRDRTTIVIAHRLSTIRGADRIHVLREGTTEEVGTHDELLAVDGLYAALWRVQTGESLLRR
ncbi:MAG: ATP-binding cassette subfamily B protein [Glaciecola sp.]|jgi:ATP-binding cassette subfamily B protein